MSCCIKKPAIRGIGSQTWPKDNRLARENYVTFEDPIGGDTPAMHKRRVEST